MKQIVYTVCEIFRNQVLIKSITFSKHQDAQEYVDFWQKIHPESTYYIEPHAKRRSERAV